jgi:hypothetical protein
MFVLTTSIPDGHAATLQGMMETARQQARAMDKMLEPYLDEGRNLSSLNLAHRPCCASTSSTCWTTGSLQCLLRAVFSPHSCYGNAEQAGPDIAKLFAIAFRKAAVLPFWLAAG